MTRIRALAVAAILATTAYPAYLLGNMHALNLQSCAQEEAFPGSGWACRETLYRLHPTADEVAEMNQSAGAIWVLSVSDESEAQRLLRHYMDAGLDINAIDTRYPGLGWTALHVAAAGLDLKGVRLLLEHGARVDTEDAQGRTPLDLVHELEDQIPQDRRYRDVAKVLRGASPDRRVRMPRNAI